MISRSLSASLADGSPLICRAYRRPPQLIGKRCYGHKLPGLAAFAGFSRVFQPKIALLLPYSKTAEEIHRFYSVYLNCVFRKFSIILLYHTLVNISSFFTNNRCFACCIASGIFRQAISSASCGISSQDKLSCFFGNFSRDNLEEITYTASCGIFSQDNLAKAKLYMLYSELMRGRIAENYQEAFLTPGIWPL